MITKKYIALFFLFFSLHLLNGQVNFTHVQNQALTSSSTTSCFFSRSLLEGPNSEVKEEGINLINLMGEIKQKIDSRCPILDLRISPSKKFIRKIQLDYLSNSITYTSEFTGVLRV